jgi:hypothetical protein
MCNLIARAAALFATTADHLGADTLTAAEETVEVFEPMQPLHWTEDQARNIHPCAWSPTSGPPRNGPDERTAPPTAPLVVEAPSPQAAVTAGENPPTGCAGSDRPTEDLLREAAALLAENCPQFAAQLRNRATRLEAVSVVDALIDDAITRHPAGSRLPKTNK